MAHDIHVVPIHFNAPSKQLSLQDHLDSSQFELLVIQTQTGHLELLRESSRRIEPALSAAETALQLLTDELPCIRASSYKRVVRVPGIRHFFLVPTDLALATPENQHLFEPRTKNEEYKFSSIPLNRLIDLTESGSRLLSNENRQYILILSKWLKESVETRGLPFLRQLFVRKQAVLRRRVCVHNPDNAKELQACSARSPPSPSTSVAQPQRDASDLNEDVRQANQARVRMRALEKCDVFVQNPMFASGLPLPNECRVSPYFVRGRAQYSPQLSADDSSGADSCLDGASKWMEQYPLHYAAYMGHSSLELIKSSVGRGLDINALDRDTWTALHYAAWYNHLADVQLLVNHGGADVNMRNRNGATPLHFAAQCANVEVVELLLSAPALKVDIKDNNGKTPYDLCSCVPKPEWQNTAALLRSAQERKLPKVQVDLMDGSNLYVTLLTGNKTTVQQLVDQIGATLRLTNHSMQLFALWICSPSLELQLKSNMRPVQQLSKWASNLEKFCERDVALREQGHLVFRRDARASIRVEKAIQLNDVALSLLYHEAVENFLRGYYPCSDQDTITLAAVNLQLTCGSYNTKNKEHLINDRSRARILPKHRVQATSAKAYSQLVDRVMSEHKLLSAKGPLPVSGLQYQFLSFCWKLVVYGSTFFDAALYMIKPVQGDMQVHAGVNDCGLHLINAKTKALIQSHPITLRHEHKPGSNFVQFKSRNSTFNLNTRKVELVMMILRKNAENIVQQNTNAGLTATATTTMSSGAQHNLYRTR